MEYMVSKWFLYGFYMGYPLVNMYMTMDRSTMFIGKTHVISTGPCSIAMLNYQRVVDWVLEGMTLPG